MPSKKILIIFLAFLFISPLVLAQRFDFRQGSENVINFLVDAYQPILYALFGSYDGGHFLFEKLLIFLLIFGLVYVSLGPMEIISGNRAVHIIISVIVPLLSVRFMSVQWINTILIQYQVLGIALAGILPFLIYLSFLHGVTDSTVVRRIGWIFFIFIYFCIWATTTYNSYAQVYFWTMLIALIFMLLDRTIHYYFMKQSLQAAESTDKWDHIRRLRQEIRETKEAINSGDLPESKAKMVLRKKEKNLSWWLKQ